MATPHPACACGAPPSYGHHCLARADAEDRQLSPFWTADIVPVQQSVHVDPTVRTLALLVAAGDVLLYAKLVHNPPADVAPFAKLLYEAVKTAMATTGLCPVRLCVFHADVAGAMTNLTAEDEVEIQHVLRSRAAVVARNTYEAEVLDFAGPMPSPSITAAPTFAALGLSAEKAGALLTAAAAFDRAGVTNSAVVGRYLQMTTPRESTWYVTVIAGGGATGPGILLCEDLTDLDDFLVPGQGGGLKEHIPAVPYSAHPGDVIRNRYRCPCLWLTFEPLGAVPPAMRQEAHALDRDAARRATFPRLIAMNTPGCGVTAEQVDDVIDALQALPGYVDSWKWSSEWAKGTADSYFWSCRESDVDFAELARPKLLDPRGPAALNELLPTLLLTTSCPQGPAARVGEYYPLGQDLTGVLAEERAIVGKFLNWLTSGDQGWEPVPADVAGAYARGIALFADYLVLSARVPVLAMTEVDVRRYLYCEWPETNDSISEASRFLASFDLFFEYLSFAHGLSWPNARRALRETSIFGERCMSCPRLGASDPATVAWNAAIEKFLRDGVLVPEPEISGGAQWAGSGGPRRNALWQELSRRWIVWHDDAMHAGITWKMFIENALYECQSRWEHAPRLRDDGLSAAQIIERERAESST
jgi:hypothetical protein